MPNKYYANKRGFWPRIYVEEKKSKKKIKNFLGAKFNNFKNYIEALAHFEGKL